MDGEDFKFHKHIKKSVTRILLSICMEINKIV